MSCGLRLHKFCISFSALALANYRWVFVFCEGGKICLYPPPRPCVSNWLKKNTINTLEASVRIARVFFNPGASVRIKKNLRWRFMSRHKASVSLINLSFIPLLSRENLVTSITSIGVKRRADF